MRRRVTDEELLRGRRVLVVAGMPDESASQAAQSLETEEAVAAIIRAVMAEGGTVDLVADEPLALLGAIVAGEYFEPRPAEPVDREAPERREERRLQSEQPPIRITSRRSDDALEWFVDQGQIEKGSDEDPFDDVTRTAAGCAALVCIGDAPFDAVIQQFRQRNRDALIFTFAFTGRAARDLGERHGVRALDAELNREDPPRSSRRDEDRRGDERFESPEARDLPLDFEFQFPPIALAAQLIVRRIADEITT